MEIAASGCVEGKDRCFSKRGRIVLAAVIFIGLLSAALLGIKSTAQKVPPKAILAQAAAAFDDCFDIVKDENGKARPVGSRVKVEVIDGNVKVTNVGPDRKVPPGTCQVEFTDEKGNPRGFAGNVNAN